MPGTVISVNAAPGQSVTRGQGLLVMESMKLETTVSAPRDGVLKAIHVGTGQTFDRDALLVEFEPAGGAP
ncbi:MAG: acetyl-CoA carboxylase biotin carboxyl carrier protein subunit [Burkholderiales bacterium]|nr:acetyl-CoA carboxylase biotin carboxyl carrier protein subunit [Burkholderiales bacterium]